MKKNLLFFLLPFLFISCLSDFNINFKESEKNGNTIVKAIETYYNDFNEYPDVLEQLIPKYLDHIPNVVTKHESKNPYAQKYFFYQHYNIIPKYGCFIIEFTNKETARKFKYDSRSNKFEWTSVYTIYPEKIEINIDFKDVQIIIDALDKYFFDNKYYPNDLSQLIPDYLKQFPFNIYALYKPRTDLKGSNIFSYKAYEPSIYKRGDYQLYFKVAHGIYVYIDDDEWYYDD